MSSSAVFFLPLGRRSPGFAVQGKLHRWCGIMATDHGHSREEEGDQEGEEERFFDALDDLSFACGSGLGSSASTQQPLYPLTDHRAWFDEFASVEERRRKFSRALGLSFVSRSGANDPAQLCNGITGDAPSFASISSDAHGDQIQPGRCMSLCSNCEDDQNVVSLRDEIADDTAHFSRMTAEGEAVLMCSYLEDATSTSEGSSPGFRSEDGASDENRYESFTEDGSRCTVTFDDQSRSFGSSSYSHTHLTGTGENTPTASTSSCGIGRRKGNGGWLRRLGIVSCVFNKDKEDGDSIRSSRTITKKGSRVKVHLQRKKFKEFSAIHMGQDVKAHEGAVCTMKFSPDGHYLATGGKDGVVRVWHVTMCEFRDNNDLLDEDPACIYVSANQKLLPELMCKSKQNKIVSRITHKTVDVACVVVPHKVFHISEKPLHEFPGHHGDVLDLSWSRNKYLVSSSMDKTVCLWQLGCDNCINVFPHNDFVTCVQFSPKEDSYIITGSLDGKVRIWDVVGGRVINWTDVREMITAICYHPDGKELVVGTMTGNCFFYSISEEHLQLTAKYSLEGKKKFPSKRITGFQYCPSNSQRLLVTSGDSLVIILENCRVIYKYKGLQNTASRISASFTVDGSHIVSASEDSRVYIWNHKDGDIHKRNHPEKTLSCENFSACNTSIAIPWHGFDSEGVQLSKTPEIAPFQYEALSHSTVQESCNSDQSDTDSSLFSSACSTFTLGLFADFLPRRAPTWPEELLSGLANTSALLSKSDYKFLKTACQNMVVSPHAWGQVIVTAGWDGYIRWFCNYGLPLRM